MEYLPNSNPEGKYLGEVNHADKDQYSEGLGINVPKDKTMIPDAAYNRTSRKRQTRLEYDYDLKTFLAMLMLWTFRAWRKYQKLSTLSFAAWQYSADYSSRIHN